jgi:hypothetical protein
MFKLRMWVSPSGFTIEILTWKDSDEGTIIGETLNAVSQK